MRSVGNGECGKYGVLKMRSTRVAEMRSVENVECRKYGVWKMRCVENAERRKCLENFNFPFQFPCNAHAECGKQGVCTMEINKYSLIQLYSH